MLVYKDTSPPLGVRLDAAKCAINYESPRLAMVAAKVDTAGQAEVRLSRQELAEQARREIAEAFRECRTQEREEERTKPLTSLPPPTSMALPPATALPASCAGRPSGGDPAPSP
jgi:hypothetical protein